MKSKLLESKTASNDKHEKLIHQSKYLDINNMPKDSLFTLGDHDAEEMAEQFGLNGRLCSRIYREFKESKRGSSFCKFSAAANSCKYNSRMRKKL